MSGNRKARHLGVTFCLVSEHVASTADPIRLARLAMNGEVVVVAGLIALAVGQEIVIVHPRGHASVALSLLLFGGPLMYLLAQAWYLRVVRGQLPRVQLAGAGALILAGTVSPFDAAVRRFGADDEPPRGSGGHIPSAGDLGRDSVTGRWSVSSGVRRWPRWTPVGRVAAAH